MFWPYGSDLINLHTVLNMMRYTLCYTEGYTSGLRHTRPLNIIPLEAESCSIKPEVVNLRYAEMHDVPGNFTKAQSLAIISDTRNYDFQASSVWSLGKNCDVTVSVTDFKAALSKVNLWSTTD